MPKHVSGNGVRGPVLGPGKGALMQPRVGYMLQEDLPETHGAINEAQLRGRQAVRVLGRILALVSRISLRGLLRATEQQVLHRGRGRRAVHMGHDGARLVVEVAAVGTVLQTHRLLGVQLEQREELCAAVLCAILRVVLLDQVVEQPCYRVCDDVEDRLHDLHQGNASGGNPHLTGPREDGRRQYLPADEHHRDREEDCSP
mmetsp:Transcript_49457/g.153544  ORF Transcript_49457/g.153544 Transcript_49457/m.153544 type:complete len:201 (-) Transcript_49457:1188-1790(-)